jgi:hypothetical protein
MRSLILTRERSSFVPSSSSLPSPIGDDLAFLRLLLRALREEDASRGALLGFDALDEHAVSQGADHSGLLRGGHGLLGLGGHGRMRFVVS